MAKFFLIVATLFLGFGRAFASDSPLVIGVMDPLSKPLSCPCVEGYAQRDYRGLGEYLQGELGRPVRVVFGGSLDRLVSLSPTRQVDVLVGKRSLAEAEIRREPTAFCAELMLTDRKGETTLAGLVVVKKEDPAEGIADLAGYEVILGPEYAAEKNSAVRAVLEKAGVPFSVNPGLSDTCNESALRLIESGRPKVAAAISSYALALIYGCETLPEGALKVVCRTEALPFVTLYFNRRLGAEERGSLRKALLAVSGNPELLERLESKNGFVPVCLKKKTDEGR